MVLSELEVQNRHCQQPARSQYANCPPGLQLQVDRTCDEKRRCERLTGVDQYIRSGLHGQCAYRRYALLALIEGFLNLIGARSLLQKGLTCLLHGPFAGCLLNYPLNDPLHQSIAGLNLCLIPSSGVHWVEGGPTRSRGGPGWVVQVASMSKAIPTAQSWILNMRHNWQEGACENRAICP